VTEGQRGQFAPNLGGTTKRKLSSQSYGTGAFFCSFYDPITPCFSGKLSNITRKGVFLWQK
ncbi:MAG: hypothetical protein ACLTGM_08825, partial [Oscillospiraceae bacterium]